MSAVRNILFIMCDQLRADHLGCYGHLYLATRNIDALTARGVRFERAFVQSGVCGPSRMSMYTGRYVSSHGATWNRVPLSIGEITLGEYLRDAGRTLALSGKTHVLPDTTGMTRLHLDGGDELGRLLGAGGFAEIDRHDGHHPEPGSPYAAWEKLRRSDQALHVGDMLEIEDGVLRIYKYVGFEEAKWFVPEPLLPTPLVASEVL